MFERLGKFVSRFWVLVLLAWVGLAVGLHAVAPRWKSITQDGDLAYLPERMPSVRGERLLTAAFPDQKAKSQIALVTERVDGPLTADDYEVADRLAARFDQLRDELPIVDITTRHTEIIGDKLTSRAGPTGQATLVVLNLTNEFMAVANIEVLKRVLDVLDKTRSEVSYPSGLRLGVTGSAALGGDMLLSATQSIRNTEWATIILVVVILLLVYRAPVLALIPLLTIGLSFVVATDLLALLTQLKRVPGFEWWNFKVFSTTQIFIVVILFGAGTDFCLFLISRFREELEHHHAGPRALAASVGSVGHALVGSALTTICGLGTMYFADFGKFRNSGPAIALSLIVTLFACVTAAPALLRACGDWVFWPLGVKKLSAADMAHDGLSADAVGGFWDWTSRAIIRRPGMILLASFVLLAPLAWAGWDVNVTYDLLNELRADRPSVVGTRAVQRHFPAGDLTPIVVLAQNPNGEFNRKAGDQRIARLTKQLYDLPGVAGVRSMAEPLGNKPGFFQPFSSEGLKKLASQRHKTTKAVYLTQVPNLVGKVARFDVISEYQPFSLDAVGVVDRLDQDLKRLARDPQSEWYQTEFDFAGTTAGIRDLKAVTESDQTLIQRLVVVAVLAVLIVILRRPLICLYLVFSVLFSYYVTMGVTKLLFAWLYAGSFDGLDWKVPIFLFVILIAVGEDYNIYLVTRVNEEQRRHGPMAGLRLATARTGGIITSCGVIMAGTFVSMMTGNLRAMLELGFALSFGVMLDTCVVRPILVPAFIALVDRRRPNTSAANSLESPTDRKLWMAVQP